MPMQFGYGFGDYTHAVWYFRTNMTRQSDIENSSEQASKAIVLL